jgi:hypothetical protein
MSEARVRGGLFFHFSGSRVDESLKLMRVGPFGLTSITRYFQFLGINFFRVLAFDSEIERRMDAYNAIKETAGYWPRPEKLGGLPLSATLRDLSDCARSYGGVGRAARLSCRVWKTSVESIRPLASTSVREFEEPAVCSEFCRTWKTSVESNSSTGRDPCCSLVAQPGADSLSYLLELPANKTGTRENERTEGNKRNTARFRN